MRLSIIKLRLVLQLGEKGNECKISIKNLFGLENYVLIKYANVVISKGEIDMELILGLLALCAVVAVLGFLFRVVLGLFGMIIMGAAVIGAAVFVIMLIGEFLKLIFCREAPIFVIPFLFS